jgi:alanine racemase
VRNIGLTWVEVDKDAIQHNISEVRKLLKEETKLMGVVKADAYGHGAVETAEIMLDSGVDFLGVNTTEEGIELRKAGISDPILVFNPGIGDEAQQLIRYDLTVTLASLKVAEIISKTAYKMGEEVRAHIKIETGFGRLGILPEEAVRFAKKVEEMGNIELEGVYTHFATAAERNKSYAYEQFGLFKKAVDDLISEGFEVPLKHAANSAATLDIPETHMDMVRVGNLIYGQYSSGDVSKKLDLKNTWLLKSTVMFVREFQKSQAVSYGSEARTKKGTVLATLPIGFADGFTLLPERLAFNLRFFLRRGAERLGIKRAQPASLIEIKGQNTPIVGRVAMQHTMVDVTKLFNIMPGDVADVTARRTSVSSRIPRVYYTGGHPYKAATITGTKVFKGVEKHEAEGDL